MEKRGRDQAPDFGAARERKVRLEARLVKGLLQPDGPDPGAAIDLLYLFCIVKILFSITVRIEMLFRPIKSTGMGSHLPSKRVSAADLDRICNYSEGTSLKALENAKLKKGDIDLIIGASGTPEQIIPCNAALIHSELKMDCSIPGFDVNSTGLSFLSALDAACLFVESNAIEIF